MVWMQKMRSKDIFFPLSRCFLVWPKNKHRGRKSSFFQLMGIWSLGKERMVVLEFLWPVQKRAVIAFCPLLLSRAARTRRARLAPSDPDPSLTTVASFCLGPCRSLLLEQQHKQSMTQEFEEMYKVKGKRCNQGPEKWCQSWLLRASFIFQYRNDSLSPVNSEAGPVFCKRKYQTIQAVNAVLLKHFWFYSAKIHQRIVLLIKCP